MMSTPTTVMPSTAAAVAMTTTTTTATPTYAMRQLELERELARLRAVYQSLRDAAATKSTTTVLSAPTMFESDGFK
jgi:hypothetical protein